MASFGALRSFIEFDLTPLFAALKESAASP